MLSAIRVVFAVLAILKQLSTSKQIPNLRTGKLALLFEGRLRASSHNAYHYTKIPDISAIRPSRAK